MLRPDQIPAEAVEAARKFMRLQALSDEWIDDLLAAAINAWPGVKLENLCGWVMDGPDLPYVEETASIILPLPREKSDDAV